MGWISPIVLKPDPGDDVGSPEVSQSILHVDNGDTLSVLIGINSLKDSHQFLL